MILEQEKIITLTTSVSLTLKTKHFDNVLILLYWFTTTINCWIQKEYLQNIVSFLRHLQKTYRYFVCCWRSFRRRFRGLRSTPVVKSWNTLTCRWNLRECFQPWNTSQVKLTKSKIVWAIFDILFRFYFMVMSIKFRQKNRDAKFNFDLFLNQVNYEKSLTLFFSHVCVDWQCT